MAVLGVTVAVEGVDYSFAGPNPARLAAAGKKFAVRYGALGDSGKLLTASEVTALRAAGLDIVANVEETARAFRWYAGGQRHAAAGDPFFRKLGMGPDRPIYFSIDWDAGPADWPAVDAAVRGAASVLGAARVGVYGGYDTIAHCASVGVARWFWQTYAWSTDPNTGKTRWHPACHLQQYSNNIALAGGTVDLDRAVTADYGQWGGRMAVLIPCLVTLRSEVNALNPNRDKSSDGWIGDAAHAASSSDHNPDETGSVPIHDADTVDEVHAIDVDSTGPWPAGLSMERIVQLLLARCRSGAETRLRYIIYNRRIWSASSGWVEQAYSGSDPHTNHGHFSASYDSAREADTSPWHLADLLEDAMPTPADYAQAVASKLYADLTNPAGSGLKTQLTASEHRVIAGVAAAITGTDFTDEQAIVAGVLAGLTGDQVESMLRRAYTPEQLADLAARLQGTGP